MGSKKREKVWLAVAGFVIMNEKWLVVKKRYGGLKGKWSLPAGFVDPNETIDQAVVREVLEETGIETEVQGLCGIRTGVLEGEISDNMVIFALRPVGGHLMTKKDELYETAFLSPSELENDPASSELVRFLLQNIKIKALDEINHVNPGDHFGYQSYKLFIPE